MRVTFNSTRNGSMVLQVFEKTGLCSSELLAFRPEHFVHDEWSITVDYAAESCCRTKSRGSRCRILCIVGHKRSVSRSDPLVWIDRQPYSPCQSVDPCKNH